MTKYELDKLNKWFNQNSVIIELYATNRIKLAV